MSWGRLLLRRRGLHVLDHANDSNKKKKWSLDAKMRKKKFRRKFSNEIAKIRRKNKKHEKEQKRIGD